MLMFKSTTTHCIINYWEQFKVLEVKSLIENESVLVLNCADSFKLPPNFKKTKRYFLLGYVIKNTSGGTQTNNTVISSIEEFKNNVGRPKKEKGTNEK